jgi:hypothetical protein
MTDYMTYFYFSIVVLKLFFLKKRVANIKCEK